MKRWRVGNLKKLRFSRRQVLSWIGWALLVAISMVAAAYAVAGVGRLLLRTGWLAQANVSVINLILQCFVHVLTIVAVCTVAWRIKKAVSAKQAGVQRLIEWRDIGMAIVGAVAYIALTVSLSFVAQAIIPGFNPNQAQDIGVSDRLFSLDLAIAFVVLVIVVPLCEELIFRGILYGKLRSAKLPVAANIFFVSLLFGVAHGQWNVGIDTFALSLVLCTLREYTGSIWSGFLLHAIKNSVAFYAVYVAAAFW